MTYTDCNIVYHRIGVTMKASCYVM